jgi:alkanesulfonate monooxygenase SsuD/methylene tetrahydromethanopterin reductase-like flavin-dependent oxidoreductase (luciferase family)
MKLSVLDRSTSAQGSGQDVAIRETLDLSRHCEALGYHRYWVSEHHNGDSIVGTARSLDGSDRGDDVTHPCQGAGDAAALLR